MKTRQKWWFGHLAQPPDNEVNPVTIEAPEGHEVEVNTLQCLNDQGNFVLIDGRLGDRLLPWECPIDVAFFKDSNSEFKIGTITPEAPLKLYFRVLGYPSVIPWLDFVLTGYLDDWKAPVVQPENKKKVGELVVKDYVQWLKSQGVTQDRYPMFIEPLNHYMNGTPLPEESKSPGFTVLAKYLKDRGLLDQQASKKKGRVIPPSTIISSGLMTVTKIKRQ